MDFDFSRFQRQWNLTADGNLWILKPENIDQIRSHTCQGLECDYIGVIIDPDLRRDSVSGLSTTYPRSAHDTIA